MEPVFSNAKQTNTPAKILSRMSLRELLTNAKESLGKALKLFVNPSNEGQYIIASADGTDRVCWVNSKASALIASEPDKHWLQVLEEAGFEAWLIESPQGKAPIWAVGKAAATLTTEASAMEF